jgi:hypothetical protein
VTRQAPSACRSGSVFPSVRRTYRMKIGQEGELGSLTRLRTPRYGVPWVFRSKRGMAGIPRTQGPLIGDWYGGVNPVPTPLEDLRGDNGLPNDVAPLARKEQSRPRVARRTRQRQESECMVPRVIDPRLTASTHLPSNALGFTAWSSESNACRGRSSAMSPTKTHAAVSRESRAWWLRE